MLAKEIKNGAVVNYNGAPVLINSVTVQTPSARGAATLYKFRGRNLVNKQKTDITLKGTESLDEADFERRSVKMMYTDPTHMYLLDQVDYNQFTVSLEDVEDEKLYVTEELEGLGDAIEAAQTRVHGADPERALMIVQQGHDVIAGQAAWVRAIGTVACPFPRYRIEPIHASTHRSHPEPARRVLRE